MLYICGPRRSGAIMLEGMLSQAAGVLGLGDVRAFWRVAFAPDGAVCSCGRPLRNCPLWGHVLARLPQGVLDAARLRHTIQHKLRLPPPRWAWWSGRGPDYTGAYEELLRATALLYGLVGDASDDCVLVDSTGSALYGALLGDVPDLRVHVMHLVRDPRAVAYSYKQHAALPASEEERERTAYSARRCATTWRHQNKDCRALARTAASYVCVRYEDLEQEPYGTVARILKATGLDVPVSGELEHGRVYFDGMHAAAGSPLRFMRGGMLVRADDAWHSGLTLREKTLVTLLTSPLLLKYGYLLRSPRPAE